MRRELITQAAEEAALSRTYACCGTEGKFCNSDEWRGNLEVFAKAVLRLAAAQDACDRRDRLTAEMLEEK